MLEQILTGYCLPCMVTYDDVSAETALPSCDAYTGYPQLQNSLQNA
ncbi:hypothetical protein MKA31_10450 [[Clostridium] innocuum]|nr:hypothetical protein [[Clostridium] innocuum]